MKHLFTTTVKTLDPSATFKDSTNFRKRDAARAVLLSEDGGVYLLHLAKYNSHKLPGGAINPGEKPEEAVLREILEETGCHAKIERELGLVVEYKDFEELEQRSYCYLARQVDERGKQALDEGEIEDGHDLIVAKGVDEAIRLLENETHSSPQGRFIRHRELKLLREAKKFVA